MEQTVSQVRVDEYDVVILGSGEGGKYLAWSLGHDGKKVAVVEQRYIGGSCPNIACLPSKNIIHSAKVASLVGRGAEFGVMVDSYHIDAKAVFARKRAMVNDLVQMHLRNYESAGVDLVLGTGRFIGPKMLEVSMNDGTHRCISGKHVVIGTGTHATWSDVPGMDAVRPWTHVEALDADVVPGTLIIVGGGYVGLEFAQAALRFGSKVIVVERGSRLIGREDEDVSAAVEALLVSDGAEIVLDALVERAAGHNGSEVRLTLRKSGQEMVVIGTHLIIAAGRTPNTAELNLAAAGVQVTSRGFISVNERLETSAAGVWAIGEVAGSPQFTHISFDDFRVVRDNMAGGDRTTTGRLVPYTLFTDPELARVGLSEIEASRTGINYRVFQIPMSAVLRTRTLGETRGFLKALVDDEDFVVGFTAFGTGAGEIMGAVQMAMMGRLRYTQIKDGIFTHPTLLEGLVPLFSGSPRAIVKVTHHVAASARLER